MALSGAHLNFFLKVIPVVKYISKLVHCGNSINQNCDICKNRTPGADPGFQVRGGGGAHLNFFLGYFDDFTPKNHIFSIVEGGAKIFEVFRVKNHDFTPKNHIFSIVEGGAKIFEVFRVKNHDFTPKNLIFSNFRGARAGCAPPP